MWRRYRSIGTMNGILAREIAATMGGLNDLKDVSQLGSFAVKTESIDAVQRGRWPAVRTAKQGGRDGSRCQASSGTVCLSASSWMRIVTMPQARPTPVAIRRSTATCGPDAGCATTVMSRACTVMKVTPTA